MPQWNPCPGASKARASGEPIITASAPQAIALDDVAAGAHAAVGDDLDVVAGLLHVRGPRIGDVDDRRRLRDADPEHAARRARRARADADEDAGGTGPHQVQTGVVGGAAADDDRHVELAG